MIYELFIKGENIEVLRQFTGFVESFKSTRYVNLEYRNKGGEKSALIKVMCNKDDYIEAWYWLRNKKIEAKITQRRDKD